MKKYFKILKSYANPRLFLVILGLLGLTLMSVVFYVYDKKVNFSIMFGPAEWGQFGDFVGGVTNPLLAFLTFVGVLWTISLTHDERKGQDIQDKKNDIFRVIEIIHSECIDLLRVSRNSSAFDCFESPKQLIEFLKNCPVVVGDNSNKTNWYLFYDAFKGDIKDLTYKLYMMKSLLSEFENLSNNYYVSDYYKAFYGRYIEKLHMIGILKDDALASFYTDIIHEYAKTPTDVR